MNLLDYHEATGLLPQHLLRRPKVESVCILRDGLWFKTDDIDTIHENIDNVVINDKYIKLRKVILKRKNNERRIRQD